MNSKVLKYSGKLNKSQVILTPFIYTQKLEGRAKFQRNLLSLQFSKHLLARN